MHSTPPRSRPCWSISRPSEPSGAGWSERAARRWAEGFGRGTAGPAEGDASPSAPSALAALGFPPWSDWRWRAAAYLAAWGALLATFAVTAELWTVREGPLGNYPAAPLPPVNFQPWLAGAFFAAAAWPRWGVLLLGAVFAVSALWDELRWQPEIVSLWLVAWGCAWGAPPRDLAARIARWHLATMWLWAGLHKLLSPEWRGPIAARLLEWSGAPADALTPFAWGVALAEIGLAVWAVVRPRSAAWGCLVLHLAIGVSLSAVLKINESVWPWNIALAFSGAWLLATAPRPTLAPRSWREWLAAAALLAVPAGFYTGWVDPPFAWTLYSGLGPRGWRSADGLVEEDPGWVPAARVPFNRVPRLHVAWFERVAEPGDKLQLLDPRPGLPDRFYRLGGDRRAAPISRERFLAERAPDGSPEVAGRLRDDVTAVFWLERQGAELERADDGVVHRAVCRGPEFGAAALAWLAGLPHLRELVVEEAPLGAAELRRIGELSGLRELSLRETPVGDGDLAGLAPLRGLELLSLEDTRVTGRGLAALAGCERLATLRLSGSPVDAAGLAELRRFPRLTELWLHDTPLTDAAVAPLAELRQLELLGLGGTALSPAAKAELAERLPQTQVVD